MPRKKQAVPDSPEVEVEDSTELELPSAELEAQAVGRMVHIENELLKIRQEMSEYKEQLSKLNELNEIKEMIMSMHANQATNQRFAQGPPPQPPPRQDKNKGVLGGPPSADPTPWHMQAGPSRPPPGWNPDHFEDHNGTNGGHNGHHVDHTVNIGGPNAHHTGHNGYNGGQQHSSSGLGNRDTYGPQTSQYGARFGGTQWENVNTERRWGDRVERDPPMWEPHRERQDRQRDQPRIPQVRIEFPRFNGEEPLDWIFLMEQYFTCQMIHEEDWLQTATLLFDGKARRWLRWLKLKEPVNTWDEFKEALILRFGASSYVDFDIELRNLKQTTSVQEYQARFEDLASMVDWTPKALIAAFVGGLKDEIQIDVQAEPNTELRKCFAKARSVEDRQHKKQALYRQWRPPSAVKIREIPQQPKMLPAPPKKVEPKPVYRSRIPPTLTREEREEMIWNKQCFWCKENWDPSHRCKHIRVYSVEQELYEENEGDLPPVIEEVEEVEVGAHTGALQNPREANFLSLPTASTMKGRIICCETKSSTLTTENVKAPSRACVEISREVKAPLHIEDLGGLGLADLDPPGLSGEDLNLPGPDGEGLGALSLGDEDPVYTRPVEESLVTHDLGNGGLGLVERTGDPNSDKGLVGLYPLEDSHGEARADPGEGVAGDPSTTPKSSLLSEGYCEFNQRDGDRNPSPVEPAPPPSSPVHFLRPRKGVEAEETRRSIGRRSTGQIRRPNSLPPPPPSLRRYIWGFLKKSERAHHLATFVVVDLYLELELDTWQLEEEVGAVVEVGISYI
ncbi:hypothetical protein EJ110_NYTH32579 [Nymphaea thermarum]|nr:hypothetical protein EJ110_NYTH32579 [Nymphaea thermarum]